MVSKENFHKAINDYYYNRIREDISENHVKSLIDLLTDHFFNQYKEFSKMYPKSIKRYSKLDTKDLENPLTHDLIISFFKKKYSEKYIDYSSKILGLSNTEFLDYEKRRTNFYDMF